MKKSIELLGVIFLVLGLVLTIHHVIFFGRIADIEDILHHEFFEAILLTAGFTLLLCSFTQKSR